LKSFREEALEREIFNLDQTTAQPANVQVKEEHQTHEHSPSHSPEHSRAETKKITQADPGTFIEEHASYLYRTSLETIEVSLETRSTTDFFNGPDAWYISKSSHLTPTRDKDIVDVKEKWTQHQLGGEYFNVYEVKRTDSQYHKFEEGDI
jgi:hypothetical protein